jgi:hypothetical protein
MTLEPDALCDAARAETGLDDFEGDGFREGLHVLCEAIDKEAQLHEAGQLGAQGHLTRLLATRLRVTDWRRRHPEIGAQEVPRPVFMIGLPRTGTTALAALLQRDPLRRSLLAWESSTPVPPPELATRDSDPRIAATQAGIDAMHALRPELRAMYDAVATASTECHDLLGMEFKTQHFCGQYWVPSYAAWQRDCDMESAYRQHKRVLQLLQWRCPPSTWHLHSPVHLLSLDDLLRVYPDALFLMTHRDPASVLGSVCSLISGMLSLGSDRLNPYAVGRDQLDVWAEGLRRAARFRKRIGEMRFADVYFQDLVADPVGTVERAYARLGLEFDERARQGMSEWAQANPRGRHGEHRYRLEDYGLDVSRVHAAFGFYLESFDVRVEA